MMPCLFADVLKIVAYFCSSVGAQNLKP